MKNKMKRFLSGMICLALLLTCCGMAFATDVGGGTADPTPTPAPEAPRLTVKGNANAIGSTVEGYRLFEVTTDGTGENTTYTYLLNPVYNDFFATLGIPGYDTLTTDKEKSNAAYKYVLGLSKGESRDTTVKAFADALTKWIHDNKKDSDLPLVNGVAVKMAKDGEKTKAVIGSVPYGYYLIFVGHAPASLVNVIADDNNVEVKSQYPTLDKKVMNHGIPKDATSAEIGKSVSFVLTSEVPDMDGYTKYIFNFKDTMTKGLTFNNDATVQIGDDILTRVYEKDAKYYSDEACTTQVVGDAQNTKSYVVTSTVNADKTTDVKIELLNFIQYDVAKYKNASIIVNYTARVNKDASINEADKNSATVEYSNDPSSDTTGESTPEVVEVYTFDFSILKVAHGTDSPLAGAEFALRRSDVDGADDIELVSIGTNTYRLADTDDAAAVKVTRVTTDATGKIMIQGLAKGKYYLYETKAPEDYNLLAEPVVIEIIVNYKPDGTPENWSITGGTQQTDGTYEVKIENRSGSILPETGAIGTAIFAIVGVGLVIGGTQLMSRKKKDEESER